jgi:hypothetical protein
MEDLVDLVLVFWFALTGLAFATLGVGALSMLRWAGRQRALARSRGR